MCLPVLETAVLTGGGGGTTAVAAVACGITGCYLPFSDFYECIKESQEKDNCKEK